MFHGFDFDNTMLRIGSMNMLLHGVENPDIRYRDSLAQDHAGEEERYSLVLANPPFAGSLDYENTAKDLQQIVKTKKTELLFLALFIRLLKPGGRAAVIVPDGVLFGSSNAHKTLRKILVEDQKLDAVDLAAERRVQAVCRCVHRHPAVHEDQLRRHRPRLVLRRAGRRLVARRQANATALRGQARRRAGDSRSPPTNTQRTTCPTCSRGGPSAPAMSSTGRGPTKASASRRPTSSRRATTSASTATRKSSTKRLSTAPPLDILADLATLEDEIQARHRRP